MNETHKYYGGGDDDHRQDYPRMRERKNVANSILCDGSFFCVPFDVVCVFFMYVFIE